ncbi:MAG: phenylalanine--tRNA ligase subunit beta [Candidatus Magasanikbacteria bacterium]|jgi:phenylalanyl-tRNA synthetase beta chain|nr:phenylalanine--tRNA ligase subunit beta [Candidatus Magasanikbacteria bacterium]MBT4314549.1 phenylalanine--tRNA ligase subunit beta [Candidatus Magasanikbacteria bacterium]MBT4547447.1 phenylalanine--tRNA ligase subunit beta [Candidatus Magasanikbacteria bacterium]MBT6819146.1 phenylalanine--tRNA ligase subunit beta [Candidatus Magasanikbacteria bacterium]
MLLSYNWIKNYVDLPDSLTPEELGLKLTMSTVEVEGVEKQGKDLENIVVGIVKKVEKHPDADKLQLCRVYDGTEDWQVVCGGSNVVKNMKVALGRIGAKVKWHGEGDLIELTKAKIRGVESFGMICASSEIGLGDMFPLEGEKEILDLSSIEAKAGTTIAKALELDDVVYDIDNKSMTHRPDLWGHYGMSREVAALYNKKLVSYNPPAIKPGKEFKIKVDIKDTKLCPRYMAVAIDGIKVEPSPDWLQKKLLAVGLNPINNIVDITNYILFDLGQPMHAFDAAHLKGKKNKEKGVNILARRAEVGEKFVTLDEKEHDLTNEDLVIATEEKAVALAGVMGGLNSEIKNDTTTIVFESANFDALNTRRTATRLGIRTDSSSRFEKSLDANNCELALKRAVELTLELCPNAKVVSSVADESNFSLNQGPIELSLEFINKKIGVELEKKQVVKILESLGFDVKDKKDILFVTVPTWRATKDISIAEDLVEEVARIYGYGNIETVLPTFSITPPERNELKTLENKIKDILSLEFGFNEVYNYSFISPKWIEIAGLDEDSLIELDNPVAKDRPYLRRSLWPNMLENVEKNLHEFDSVKIFEVGQVFDKNNPGVRAADNSDELLPRQDLMLGLAFASKGVGKPFYEVSSAISGILDNFNCDYELKAKSEMEGEFIHPGRTAEVIVNGEVVGAVGEIHPVTLYKIGIDERTAVVEISLNKLIEQVAEKNNYKKLSVYPAVERDVAFLVDKKVTNTEISEKLKNVDELVKGIELFDVYDPSADAQGKIPEGKKSMAYHITYRSDEKTLESKEIDKIHEKLTKVLVDDFDVEIR